MMIIPQAVPASKPTKRTRPDADGSDPPLPHLSSSPSTQPLSRVKRERSASPLLVEKRLVVSGTKRFTPIPSDCLPPCVEYRQNRLEWVARCVKELEALNLIPERSLFRDDGLVIDWRSHVPVWSDTLKPNPQLDLAAEIVLTHRSNAQLRRPSSRRESPAKSVTTISTQERRSSPPPTADAEPRPSSKQQNIPLQSIPIDTPPSRPGSSSPCPAKLFPDEREREGHSPSRDRVSELPGRMPKSSDISFQNSQIGTLQKSASKASGQPVALPTPSVAEEEMEEMTLNYLRRYVQTYESDRASLAFAYAGNASFGYRVHYIIQNAREGSLSVWATSPRCFSSGSKQTRLDVVTTLLILPSLHLDAQNWGVARIEYDIFYLGAKHGMFVVCRLGDSTKTVVHNFILQRKEVDVEDAAIEDVWPLTATAHQILVFQT